MVCPRCITAVESILHRFNLSIVSISLGEATVAEDNYGNIKTAHCCFKTGVAAYDKEPTFKSNLLIYEGRYLSLIHISEPTRPY